MDHMILLDPDETVPIVDGEQIDRIIEALRNRYVVKGRKYMVKFPTMMSHPSKNDRAYLIVEIDSVEHGPSKDGSDWVIIGTLWKQGDFWSKSGDLNSDPKVRIAYNSEKQDGAFELHLES